MTTAAPQLGSRAGPIEATQVTGRRVVATLIDGLVFGVAYWLLALAFGDIRAQGEAANWVANLPTAGNLVVLATTAQRRAHSWPASPVSLDPSPRAWHHGDLP
jgi:hypothetical protein